MAHKFVYQRIVGPIRGSNEIDHLCEVRNCCNPEHLDQVTRKKNLDRRYGKRRKRITEDGEFKNR